MKFGESSAWLLQRVSPFLAHPGPRAMSDMSLLCAA
jgi:hypothetical protein